MKKLYEKSEIWFAVGWIMIYVIVMGNMRANFGESSVLSLLALILIAGAITVFIFKNNLSEKYGLERGNLKGCLFFIPFVLLSFVNLIAGVKMHYTGSDMVTALLLMALVGYVEELIFRGLLFKAMEKDNLRSAVIVTALTFGAGHIINLFTGQIAFETLLQIVYAVAIGFAFVAAFIKTGSLIPCIVTHSLVDMTSLFSGEFSRTMDILISVVITLVMVIYGCWLLKEKKLNE
ncbi:MAG: CPBP family intramembrane metalloprotease [Clostridia bacterium]|nr:CPBP family intramembrane metalloprotease [Clostridia bacterium]